LTLSCSDFHVNRRLEKMFFEGEGLRKSGNFRRKGRFSG
jgi:hypothetical protein